VFPGHLRGAIGRSVVDDDDLVRGGDVTGRGVNRSERRAQQALLVVGGNDERDHLRGDKARLEPDPANAGRYFGTIVVSFFVAPGRAVRQVDGDRTI